VATSPESVVAGAPRGAPAAFEVSLENFTGPFDLLLSLIAKHRLDVTEVALAQVTDEFIAHIHAAGEWDLSQASEFLVVAATLLDLKAARLLPTPTGDDEEDLEFLEARDLLFARLLQYRAFKQVAVHLGARLDEQTRSHARGVRLEPHLAALLPELVIAVGPERLAALAAGALAPRPSPPGVDVGHLHAPVVSVRDQATLLVERLRRSRVASFRTLTADADGTPVVVARFLALLELFRDGAVAFEQAGALGELTVVWTGAEHGGVLVGDDYDGAGTHGAATTPPVSPGPARGRGPGAVGPNEEDA
jgi:segregation and condensation protein A